MTPPTSPETADIETIAGRLSEAERDRLIYGRPDWRERDWQDHCGEVGCPHCEGATIPDPAPQRLPQAEQVLRAHLRSGDPQ